MDDISGLPGPQLEGRLRDIAFDFEYRSDKSQLGAALFEPCLAVATSYDRAAGFFTSSGLVVVARGLERFVEHQGTMRLVAAPLLRPDDVDAIMRGYEAREHIVTRAILRGLFPPEGPLAHAVLDRLELLSWLVAEGRLDVRVAVPTRIEAGIFHEKAAIFTDATGDVVAVSGSPNETQGGLVDNFEALDVFLSWSSDVARVERKIANFEDLWNDRTTGLEVLPVPDAVVQEFVAATSEHWKRNPPSTLPASPPDENDVTTRKRVLQVPDDVQLRDYQLAAVENWWLNDFKGILAMATGTGKTITALSAVADVFRDFGAPLILVVLAPYIHLVDQWTEELRRWGASPIRCYESSTSWERRAREALQLAQVGARDLVVLVSTHVTATLPVFKGLIRLVDGERLIVVADEVHRLGAEGLSSALPPNAAYRLGLSATPERQEDEAGNNRIFDYFDGIVFSFDIADAIKAGRLAPYQYLTSLVQLYPDELEDYEDVVRLIQREMSKPEGGRDASRLTSLMNRRSEVLNAARGKLAKLREDITAEKPEKALIYTANRRQLAAVMDLCWNRSVTTHQFTGEESRAERQELLSDLGDGKVAALVAMKCLDEGVDVPSAMQGFLLKSSGNPREFVQRRGRLLRLAPGKEKATIRDYIVVPSGRNDFERQLLSRELERVMAFAETALNGAEALDPLLSVLREVGLHGGG